MCTCREYYPRFNFTSCESKNVTINDKKTIPVNRDRSFWSQFPFYFKEWSIIKYSY